VKDTYERVAVILGTNLPPVYKPDLPGEAQETLADISAARALGWLPTVSLEQGLRSFVEYYRRTGLPCRS